MKEHCHLANYFMGFLFLEWNKLVIHIPTDFLELSSIFHVKLSDLLSSMYRFGTLHSSIYLTQLAMMRMQDQIAQAISLRGSQMRRKLSVFSTSQHSHFCLFKYIFKICSHNILQISSVQTKNNASFLIRRCQKSHPVD
jgi:hypothetical protein